MCTRHTFLTLVSSNATSAESAGDFGLRTVPNQMKQREVAAELLFKVVFTGPRSGGLQDFIGENFSFENINDLATAVES